MATTGGVDICFALTAAGGGLLISPGCVCGDGRVLLASKAWRLNNVSDHASSIRLASGRQSEEVPLSTLPAELIVEAGGQGDQLPRGLMVLCSDQITRAEVQGGRAIVSELRDLVMGRTLSHRVTLEAIDADPLRTRPLPRYSVGPTRKEVTHYI